MALRKGVEVKLGDIWGGRTEQVRMRLRSVGFAGTKNESREKLQGGAMARKFCYATARHAKYANTCQYNYVG